MLQGREQSGMQLKYKDAINITTTSAMSSGLAARRIGARSPSKCSRKADIRSHSRTARRAQKITNVRKSALKLSKRCST
jgi:hypothetical protein